MAKVPYDPNPSVAPSEAGTSYENVSVNPGAFGAGLAQAESGLSGELGQAEKQTFDSAVQSQNLFNEANTNAAQSKYLDGATAILNKPESAPGAGDGGFFTKRGDDSLASYDTAVGALNQLRSDTMQSLPNQRQQVMFDQLTRRLHSSYLDSMGRHVDQQINDAADAKTGALLTTLGQTATVAGANDPAMFDEIIQQGKGAAQSWGDRRGYGADWGQQYAQKWVGQTVQNAAEQMANAGDVAGANALFDRYRGDMDKGSALATQTHLKSRTEDLQANNWATNALLGTNPSAPDVGSIAGQIQKVEGTGQNPNSSAAGVGQFTDKTWLDTVRGSRPDLADKSDVDLLARRNDPEFASAMTHNYTAQNIQALSGANLPTTPGNVYMAHVLGPTGAIKALSADPSTPISALVSPQAVQANPTILGGGKTVADVRQWADNQMVGVGPGAAVKMDKAQTLAQAQAEFGNNPEMLRKATTAINEKYAAVSTAAAADAQARKDASEQAVNTYTGRFLKGDTQGIIGQIANDQSLQGSEKETLYAVAEKHAQTDATLAPQLYGSGFNDAMRAITLPPGDPARISDPMQILRRAVPGGDLNLAGANVLNGMIQKGKTAEGAGENTMLSSALNYAKNQLSFEADYGNYKILDPKGRDAFDIGFTPTFFKYYNQGIAEGKSPAELLDQKSLDQMIAPFKRTQAQYTQDQISAGIDVPGAAQGPRTLDAIIRDVHTGKLKPEDGKAEALKLNLVAPDAPPAPTKFD